MNAVRVRSYVGFLLLPFSLTALARSAPPDSPNSATVLLQAYQALSAGKPVISVEMTGTAHWYGGTTKEQDSGPAKLTAKVTGENSAEFDLSNGRRIESQSAITDDRTCTWSGKDGVSHDMASSNCWTATIWFLPHLALQSTGLPASLSIASADVVADKTQNAPHIRHHLTIAPEQANSDFTSVIQSWSKTDLALDPATFLPSVLKYNIHPDNNSSVNLQVEVHYSNYQNISGVELPMHIERYLNGALQVSLDINSATVN